MKKFLRSLSTLALAAGGYLGAKALVTVVFATGPTPADLIDLHLGQEPTRSVYQAMFTYFPAEAMALRSALVAVAGAGRVTDETLIRMAETGRGIRAPLARFLAGAPEAEIVALLDDQIGLYQRFADEPATCALVVARGLQALPAEDPRRTPPDLAPMMGRLFATMSAYRHAAPRVPPAEDMDYLRLEAAMTGAGLTPGALDHVVANDPSDPQLCGAYLGMLTVLRDAGFDGADRLRTEVMIALATG